MIYHFLDEAEPFSEFQGGAISRWAANVLIDEAATDIVCCQADDSWGFAAERLHLAPRIASYTAYRARRFYPAWLHRALLGRLFGDALPKLQRGDIVWVHGQPNVAATLIPQVRAAGARLVFHLHGSAFVTHTRSVLQVVAEAADLIVFCSRFLEDEARRRFPALKRTAVLYNGANGELFRPPAASEARPADSLATVLFASRLVPQKGAHILVEAMRLLHQRRVPLQAMICGAAAFGASAPTPYVESLQHDPPPNVTFTGYQHGQALAERFRASDIFCLPATYEDPFPLATLEALASGLPVIASRAGGIPEALVQGGGQLVPMGDVRALADALEHLARNPVERHRLGREARAAFEHLFTWATVRSNYRALLRELA